MNYFNIKDFDEESSLGVKYKKYVKEYPNETIKRKALCYLEEYQNEYNRRSYRLRIRDNGRIIKFWTAPSDDNKGIVVREIREFFERAKREYWNTSLFDKDGDFSILVEGQFGTVSDDEVEVIAYFTRCYYANGQNDSIYEEDINGLCKIM